MLSVAVPFQVDIFEFFFFKKSMHNFLPYSRSKRVSKVISKRSLLAKQAWRFFSASKRAFSVEVDRCQGTARAPPRFKQLQVGTHLDLWQEAYRSIEDIHSIITFFKKSPAVKRPGGS